MRKYKNFSEQVSKLFDQENIFELSKQSKFIQRIRKVLPVSLLESVLFSNSDPSKVSLNDIARYHKKHFEISLTRQAIDKRFNKQATAFVILFLKQLLKTNLSTHDIVFTNTSFKRIIIKDSTCNQLPENLKDYYPGSGGAGSASAVRIQFQYDLKNQDTLELNVTPFNKQDIQNSKETIDDVQADDLVIRDLGYICIETLRGIEDRKAWYISRLSPGTLVIDPDTRKPVDFSEIESRMKQNGIFIFEKNVWLTEKKYPCRLVIEIVPENTKQERIRKTSKEARKKGRSISKEKKARMGLNLFLTNCLSSMLSASQLRKIYGIRWQIELIFKAWKQNSQFHKIKKINIDRYEFLIYAKLIWIMLSWRIHQVVDLITYSRKRQRVSILKLFKTLSEDFREEIKSIIRGNTGQIITIIKLLLIDLSPFLIHDDRKDRINWKSVENI
ncbi:MAG: IS4 family transposase [Bacteroidales bacterium]|nr:IS4 family transposase [Bacteroidales bacterium]